jgi:hypothetical protein
LLTGWEFKNKRLKNMGKISELEIKLLNSSSTSPFGKPDNMLRIFSAHPPNNTGIQIG